MQFLCNPNVCDPLTVCIPLPFLQVLNLLLDLDPDYHIVDKRYVNVLQVCCHLVAMSSACYNPFIYASLHSKVWLHLKGYLCPCRRQGTPGGQLLSRCTSRNPATCLSLLSEVPAPAKETPGVAGRESDSTL